MLLPNGSVGHSLENVLLWTAGLQLPDQSVRLLKVLYT